MPPLPTYDTLFANFLPGKATPHEQAEEALFQTLLLQRLGIDVDGLAGMKHKKIKLAQSWAEEAEKKGEVVDPGPDGNGQLRASLRKVEALLADWNKGLDQMNVGKAAPSKAR